MGEMRFRVCDRSGIPPDGIQQIYVAGPEEIPWSTQASWDNDLLVIRRSIFDSGNVHVPWQIEGRGRFMLTTATLIERQQPYVLEVELVRGMLFRLRNRLFIWESLGLEITGEQRTRLRSATADFSRAATSQNDLKKAGKHATAALDKILNLSDELTGYYAEQAVSARQRQTPLSVLMGVSLGPEMPPVAMRRQLLEACNIIQLPVAWRAVEAREGRRDWKKTDEQLAWCQKAGLKVAAGPLLRMDDRGVPDWMYLWEGDFENLSRLLIDHVQAVVTRYAGRVHLWHVASRVNTGPLLSMEEEQRLHLVAQALDVVRSIDPRTPAVVSFDQPWAEYLSSNDADLAPLHYADALVRADLGVSGFGLEINAGFQPGGSQHRVVFELGRLIDQWSIWGLPLMLNVSTASSSAKDANARKGIQASVLQSASNASDYDPQHAWANSVIKLLLARSIVQVIFWNQLDDSTPHEFPHAGLFDANQQPKPILSLFRDLRKACLM